MIGFDQIVEGWGSLVMETAAGPHTIGRVIEECGFDADAVFAMARVMSDAPQITDEDEGMAFITGLLLGVRLSRPKVAGPLQ